MAWTASLALAYFCKRNLKNETQEIHGVDKIMEKSVQSPQTVKEFLVALHLYWSICSLKHKANANAVKPIPWFTVTDGGVGLSHLPYPIFGFAVDQHSIAAVFTSAVIHESADKILRAWSYSWLIEARGAG